MSHIHEKIDFTAQAFIVSGEKVLLRMHEKYGIWLGVGGHVELHEDPIEALYREAKEECGLEIELVDSGLPTFSNGTTLLPVPIVMQRMFVNPTHEHVDLVYAVRAKTTEIIPDNNESKVEFRWFSKDELDKPEFSIGEHVKYIAKKAIEYVNRN
jgi:8-oxo-dGTP pyrophosphatase MutT (NUDIX family)